MSNEGNPKGQGLTEKIDTASKFLSFMAGCFVFVYIFGWFYSKAYFEALGAGWLIQVAPDRYFLLSSGFSVALLAAAFAIAVLANIEQVGLSRVAVAVYTKPGWFVGISLAFFVAGWFYWGFELAAVYYVLGLIVAAMLVVWALIQGEKLKVFWHTWLVAMFTCVAFVALFARIAGREAERDRGERSSLPVVLAGGEKHRLLLVSGEKYYVLKPSKDESPPIGVLEAGQIKEIMAVPRLSEGAEGK